MNDRAARRLSEQERFDWLRLIRSENVGPRGFQALMLRYGDARAALDALPGLARRVDQKRILKIADPAAIKAEISAAAEKGVRFVARCEPEYPPMLARIDDAPPILAVQGHIESLQQPMIAVVGSRNASAGGLAFADRLARAFGAAGYVVVSGLARGIDTRAHVAALASGTVGVLAGGHARPYPPEATALMPKISQFGAVVSEMPFEWEPRGRDFPRRNRLVSGLAFATVIVEAARSSGSLITARLAGDQNREVFAVPGSPLDPRAEGTNDLLRSGAHICARAEDVLDALDPIRGKYKALGLAEGRHDMAWPHEGEPRFERDATGDPTTQNYAQVLSLLGPTPVHIDDVMRAAGFPTGPLRAMLLDLELAGKIEFQSGDRVALKIG